MPSRDAVSTERARCSFNLNVKSISIYIVMLYQASLERPEGLE